MDSTTGKRSTEDDEGAQAEQIQREKFMEISFGKPSHDNNPSQQHNRKISIWSINEYNQFIKTLRYWNRADGHEDDVTREHVSQTDFRRSQSRSWYQNAKVYKLSEIEHTDGSITETLLRIDEKSNIWKRVVHMDNVFDAIKECHEKGGHTKISTTKQIANQIYWNISEQLCRNFITTCPKCINNKTKERNTNSPRLSVDTNGLIDRYAVSVIDLQKRPSKDVYGRRMMYVLLIYDNVSNWTILRPIAELNEHIIEQEITTTICIRGHHRFHGIQSIKSASSILSIRCMQYMEMSRASQVNDINLGTNQSNTLQYITRHAKTLMEKTCSVDGESDLATVLPQIMTMMNTYHQKAKKPILRLTSLQCYTENTTPKTPENSIITETYTPPTDALHGHQSSRDIFHIRKEQQGNEQVIEELNDFTEHTQENDDKSKGEASNDDNKTVSRSCAMLNDRITLR